MFCARLQAAGWWLIRPAPPSPYVDHGVMPTKETTSYADLAVSPGAPFSRPKTTPQSVISQALRIERNPVCLRTSTLLRICKACW